MWVIEDDFMAVLEEAVKDEPPPPPGNDGEDEDVQEETAVPENGIELIMKGYEDELRSCAENSGLTAQEICNRLTRPILCGTRPSIASNHSQRPDRVQSSQVQRQCLYLPIDVFLQVASHLSPLELLRCSRMSRTLRCTLLSRKNRSIWRNALHSIPQLPMCPDGMSEPSYAALVFDDHCFACGIEEAHSVDYALRVRLCGSCWDMNVGEGVDVLDKPPVAVSCVVAMLTPCESNIESWRGGTWWQAKDIEPTRHSKYHSYHTPELVSTLESLWPPPTVKEWDVLKPFLTQHVKNLRRRQVHAVLVQRWVAMVCERRDRTFSLLDGQNEELRKSYVSQDLADIENIMPPIVRAVTQTLFPLLHRDHEWLGARHQRVFDDRDEKRFERLEEWYEELLNGPWSHFDQRMYPNRHDGGRSASISLRHYRRRDPYTRGQLWNRDTLIGLRREVAEYESLYAFFLSRLVTKKLREERGEEAEQALKAKNDLEETLSMPYALFACTDCGKSPLAYPDIHVHWREHHQDTSVCKPADLDKDESESKDYSGAEADPEEGYDSDHSIPSPTSSDFREYYAERAAARDNVKCPYWVELFEGGWEAQDVILEAAGIAKDTWIPELTQLVSSGRLYCACGNPKLPVPAGLTWGDLVEHIADELDWTYVLQEGRAPDFQDVSDRPEMFNDNEEFKCIKLLPDGADTSPAHYRMRADPEVRARIETHLSTAPLSADVQCSICEAFVDADYHCYLPTLDTADDILYHLETKHGKEFEESDLIFRVPPPDLMRC